MCDEAHVEVFCTWYMLGGREGGMTPKDAAEMPAAMRKDFLSLLRRISWVRRRVKAEKKAAKDGEQWRESLIKSGKYNV